MKESYGEGLATDADPESCGICGGSWTTMIPTPTADHNPRRDLETGEDGQLGHHTQRSPTP
jgi:hypothetical protein